MAAPLLAVKLWGMETLRAYKANIAMFKLGKTPCDTCGIEKTREHFWTKTTCRTCYVVARR